MRALIQFHHNRALVKQLKRIADALDRLAPKLMPEGEMPELDADDLTRGGITEDGMRELVAEHVRRGGDPEELLAQWFPED